MVFFFVTTEGYTIYMGADKYENEDLIRYGVFEDIWFHVDELSSAHVYLRLNKDQRLEDVTDETIQECAQLVKANSIEGCKLREVNVIYTRWRNLLKTSDMDVSALTVPLRDPPPPTHICNIFHSCHFLIPGWFC